MIATLEKLHGLGNDFLVLDTAQPLPRIAWPAIATRLCHRRRGVGADGLALLTYDGDPGTTTDLRFALYNADGSRAELSGNGIRCLVHVAYRAQERTGDVIYTVSTDVGERAVTARADDSSARTLHASVDMGVVDDRREPDGWAALGCHPDRPVVHLGLGNPHSVVGVDDVDEADLAALGALVPQVNLEVVAPGPETDAVTMRVHERGAGITEACGTGACASAVAARRWGLVPASVPEITVHMPGGDAKVRLDDPAPGRVTLTGPSVHIATVQASL
jgi:diaminopimelate epimerase